LLPSMTPLLGVANPLEAPVALGWCGDCWCWPADDDGGVGGGGGGGGGPAGRGGKPAAGCHVSAFCFDAAVRINNEFQPLKIIYQLKDISYGKEPVPVSAVNSLDNTSLPYIEYAARASPYSGHDCSDRRRCACQQLTIRSSQAITGKADIRVTYRHGRHMARALGGIYECNAKCRCRAPPAANRVVQHGLRNRLQ
uniref:Pre-SET domain-containing protein n=1 Tax=Macrostomum lignano TaxID=282301 RepID=A0A1I8F5L8_9PLAT